MSERLEVIKEVFGIHHMQTFADRETIPFNRNDIAWLINRVEELEEHKELALEMEKAYEHTKGLYHRYKQALEEVLITDDFEDPQDYIDRIVTKASEALGQEK